MENRLKEIHPGEILREEFMLPLGLSHVQLAEMLDVPASQVERLTEGKAPVSADMALRLAKQFKVSQQFWLNLQAHYDRNGGR